jgi:hypothetical protein
MLPKLIDVLVYVYTRKAIWVFDVARVFDSSSIFATASPVASTIFSGFPLSIF